VNKFLYYILLLAATVQVSAQYSPAADSLALTAGPPPMAESAEQALPAPVYTTRSFTPGFKNKYSGTDFIYETKSTPKTWWDRFLEWLGSLFGSNTQTSSGTNWTEVLINTVCFIIIGFVVYLIVRAILNKEGMWIFGRASKRISVQDAEAENIHEMDFKELIEATKAAGNYRLALRYYYLWLLKQLSVREIINWHWDKTNSDYLYEIKDSGLRRDFEYLSYIYDHSWYGDFPVDEQAFIKAEKSFKRTLNTI
jgi:hypothetical protein